MDNEGHDIDLPYLPRRIAAARDGAKLTQERLSQILGFSDRQTISAIETGDRRVKDTELAQIAAATSHPMDFFLDPFRLVGDEAAFSYRASSIKDAELDKLEIDAGKIISLWRYLGSKSRANSFFIRQSLALTESSSFEDAQAAGEAVAREMKLGEIPSQKLVQGISDFGILVLNLDLPSGVSGVAARVTNSDTIIVNRREPATRRAFDLAHELFHVLTWDTLAPQRIDRANPGSYKQKKIEQLADNFAGALLMPQVAVTAYWEKSRHLQSSLADSIADASKHFGVSRDALFWRLVVLKLVSKSEKPESNGTNVGFSDDEPPLFSRSFLERITWGLDRGEVALRRVIDILGLRGETHLRGLYTQHGLPLPADL